MRTAYFDCFSGISGDMTIGALVDAGASFEELREQLARLHVPGYELASEKVTKHGIAGTKFHVHVHDPGTQHRRLRDIETILRSSALASHIQDRTLEVFTRLAEAEATIHHTTIEQVHFHEVGAIDSIVDITGAVIGLDLLGVQRILASAVNVGGGFCAGRPWCAPRSRSSNGRALEGRPNLCTGV